MKKHDFIALLAPTGMGKTQLLLELRDRLGDVFEVVSVDSVQVYRGLDIGSAKPTLAERAHLRHHLLDLHEPYEAYDVKTFIADADTAIADIKARGKIPLLAGGTMLYLQRYVQGLAPMPSIDAAIRAEVRAMATHDPEKLWSWLLAEDPDAASTLKPGDKQRVARALEVKRQSGQSIRYWQAQPVLKGGYQGLLLLWYPQDRSQLKAQTSQRFAAMLQQGLVEELQGVLEQSKQPLDLTHASMRAIGYRQAWAYCHGLLDKPGLLEQGCMATHQYVKRQCTWLRHWSGGQAQHVHSREKLLHTLLEYTNRAHN